MPLHTPRKVDKWYRRRRAMLLTERPICEICRHRLAVEMDHIQPLHLGGSDTYDNVQALCLECHQIKTQRERKAMGKRRYKTKKPKVCPHGFTTRPGHKWQCSECQEPGQGEG